MSQACRKQVFSFGFSKAFDKVPHQRLLTKLKGYGISGKIYDWVKDFLHGRKQKVVINGSSSTTIPVTSGIPQGSVLGPILFLIYINDLPEEIDCFIKLFADDSKLYKPVSTLGEANNLQGNIDKAVVWSNKWKMTFNQSKCKHLHVGKKAPLGDYTMTNHPVEQVPYEKDLGVIVDQKLEFTVHINGKISKANRALGIIYRAFTYLDKGIFLNLFKSLVRPHLEYASTIWTPIYKKDKIAIENVQRRATRLLGNLSEKSYPERLRELGLPSLEYRRLRADVIQTYKILNNIDQVDKSKLFTMANSNTTRGHSKKLYKRRSRLRMRSNFFSNRVVDVWNSLPEEVVSAPSVNCFKSRLNSHWKKHPHKFSPPCLTPSTLTSYDKEIYKKHLSEA